MTNSEVAAPFVDFPLDRDAFRHRQELLGLADMVTLAERSDFPNGPSEDRSRREYVYLMIDSAAEKGYTIDHLEAIALMDAAVTKRYSTEGADTWDVNDGIN